MWNWIDYVHYVHGLVASLALLLGIGLGVTALFLMVVYVGLKNR